MTTSGVRLPFPLSQNNLFAGRQRRHLTKKYRAWRREADLSIMAARLPQMRVPARVSIMLHPPDNRRRDADNAAKVILDALVRMAVLQDDSRAYVQEVAVVWGAVATPAYSEVCITAA